jgi:hypothetical protein
LPGNGQKVVLGAAYTPQEAGDATTFERKPVKAI